MLGDSGSVTHPLDGASVMLFDESADDSSCSIAFGLKGRYFIIATAVGAQTGLLVEQLLVGD